ncbi:hypothetical protein T8T21_16125 (plasmid) [Limimaricola variabilis]|uniref:helix-turn-helix transcriptional regulator n=1 Tax=Limimaricola variabilis TaxID=1492771 RepID=UPI002AC8FE2F|nr:hypothetical protein [Limimaricola variabilis]WPY96300.1 hypothetical protein T8T21_16125 [Limimaricola variabilis]
MLDTPLTRADLVTFFSLAPKPPSMDPDKRPDPRPLTRVLRDLGMALRGGTTRWPVVWRALGLAEEQDPAHHAALMTPLLTAREVADLVGVLDPSIIYRWAKGKVPQGAGPFPCAIDLSGGRKDARAKRWRRAEVLAWHMGQPQPLYAKPAPVFGTIRPTP